MLIQQFRDTVYQSLLKRSDAFLDLLDALTVAGQVSSPVALSEETPFRRKFSSIFDTLRHTEIDFDLLLEALHTLQPADSQKIGRYEVYALDTTPNERPEAQTLADRGALKAQKNDPVRFGHKYSWLVRLLQWGSSWVAPVDIQRVDTELSASQVAAIQVQELDQRNPRPKVVVADSLYGNHIFLGIFREVQQAIALVRLRSNLTFYEPPKPAPKGKRGAPCKHGPQFKLSAPSRAADRNTQVQLGEQTVRLDAWQGLHLKKLPQLVGMVVKVEFLRSDGTPRYQRPLWLFWSGPADTCLQAIAWMYLWRFAIEHLFRFLKQHLGLNANQSTDPVSTGHWMGLSALAYWQLLLMRDQVKPACPAWYPAKTEPGAQSLTPGQVQRSALRFLSELGTPAGATQTAGKGKGRPKGYHPPPRTRYALVSKAKKPVETASADP